MSNINRDYMLTLNVKTGEIQCPREIKFINVDKHTANIYVKLVFDETTINYSPIELMSSYNVILNIVKPNMVAERLDGRLSSNDEVIYEFNLPLNCVNLSGSYKMEFHVTTTINGNEELIASNSAKYKVKSSILNKADETVQDSDNYPILLSLIDTVEELGQEMTKVSISTKELNQESRDELNKIKGITTESESKLAQIKADEARRQEQEATRATNEEARKAEELRRKANEADREQAETTRESAEASRIAYENKRESQERDRVSNEYDRQNYEQDREYAENARQEAETARAGAEATRVTAENERIAKENLRQEAEADRVVAEQAREASNTAMRQDITNMQNEISNFETATNREIEEIRTTTGQEIDTMKVIVENQNAKIDYIKENDRKQDILINGIFNSQDNKLTSTKEANVHDLVESKPGLLYVDNITGNTMVNCNKEADKSIVLSEAINEEGTSNITLTQGVDGAKADVYVEGNTMVNVCDQEEPVAITKSYTVETGNHVALQGEYDGKARPVVYGNTLVNLATQKYAFEGGSFLDGDTITLISTPNNYGIVNIKLAYELKPNTTYTVFLPEHSIPSQSLTFVLFRLYTGGRSESKYIGNSGDIFTLTTTSNTDGATHLRLVLNKGADGTFTINKNIIILEGDYTNKPIPDYFEGLQSSFEDKVVTQEMVDSGKELAENLGKYKVEYKVTGKNKANSEIIDMRHNTGRYICSNNYSKFDAVIPLKQGTYILSLQTGFKPSNFVDSTIFIWDKNGNKRNAKTYDPFEIKYNEVGITWYGAVEKDISISDLVGTYIQIEEGSTATDYEPYKESTKTYYLNSPLLEGDTIEDNGNNVVHVHRYGEVVLDGSENWVESNRKRKSYYRAYFKYNCKSGNVICDKMVSKNVEGKDEEGIYCSRTIDLQISNSKLSEVSISGLKQYLQSNPLTVVYKLASPTKELISQSDTILTDSYVAGHLDFDTAVPIEKVEFKNVILENKYLYAGTAYAVQFEADNVGIANITLGGTTLASVSVVKGINKISITTPDTLTDNNLVLDGIGFSASNIIVTEAVDGNFGYFKGMKSVGEQEGNKIEILSNNGNLFNKNMESTRGYIADETDKIIVDGDGIATGNRTTDYINISNFNTIYLAYKINGTHIRYALYDKNKTQIKWELVLNMLNGYKINTVNANYIRVSTGYYDDNGDNFNSLLISPVLINPHMNIDGKQNKKEILHDPLRKVETVADRYVLIDGKWYIERNCAEVTITEDILTTNPWGDDGSKRYAYVYVSDILPNMKTNSYIYTDKIPYTSSYIYDSKYFGICSTDVMVFCFPQEIETMKEKIELIRPYLQNGGLKIVYELASPVYEPIDYNPLDIYSDTTHISINSNIPAKIKVRNHGYNCMVKPRTTYTATYDIDGTPQKTTIVTPATLDDATRFTGTGTLSNFLLLEGDISNPPAFFSGMRSSFDQEYDEVKGKWKVNIRVEGNNTYNDITIYINEPLREGDIIRAENRKILVERHMVEVVLDGSEDWVDTTSWGSYSGKTIEFRNSSKFSNKRGSVLCDKFVYNKNINLWTSDFEGYAMFESNSLDIRISKFKLPTENVAGFKNYLSKNPVTAVYQLAEPVIEEVETDYTRLMLESYENATVHFNSHIFPTSTIRYQANVISTSEIMAVNDEQDSMIIDNATQIAMITLTM